MNERFSRNPNGQWTRPIVVVVVPPTDTALASWRVRRVGTRPGVWVYDDPFGEDPESVRFYHVCAEEIWRLIADDIPPSVARSWAARLLRASRRER